MNAAELYKCCGSEQWSQLVAKMGPFVDKEGVLSAARGVWWNDCSVADWLEAFKAHPRIGDVSQLKEKFQATEELCSNEQSAAMASSTSTTLEELKEWNDRYFDKHGFIFIIFATGKKADEVLHALKERYGNSASHELQNAAIEQMKITELRLSKLFPSFFPEEQKQEEQGGANLRSPVTSHVLDIANGRPAMNVPIKLERLMPCSKDAWDLVGKDVTNGDGRSGQLLQPSATVASGIYKISFDTRHYETAECGGKLGFYPNASIVFEIGADQTRQHFHVPLLYSPFGYSTYRGS
ncbi:hydroxyisourate hydrolase [Chloropicon primus]|uniref:Hydroxyisourate hydrolase n=1 Tax=Chloropicon primus TaxID=1764295 RepID=A0A5B8MZ41_9CHLO|nr:hydroxyisourate hydrolase [Chloropicon primus]|mmetsp:Transcript_14502/g.41310  ORF Transcript_14502/g.41310 Transcript_14502/m.41310 type:complete len:295 (+) Transcript_14502:2893-3777(+)|eukprot:QDZ25621.1 hydroxyisourate hydrolase [Chloropicon primus]